MTARVDILLRITRWKQTQPARKDQGTYENHKHTPHIQFVIVNEIVVSARKKKTTKEFSLFFVFIFFVISVSLVLVFHAPVYLSERAFVYLLMFFILLSLDFVMFSALLLMMIMMVLMLMQFAYSLVFSFFLSLIQLKYLNPFRVIVVHSL